MALLLDAPNKTTAVLSTGSGDPTFTRATTKNVFDNEGKLITVRSGGLTLSGARCVQNWCSAKSEDWTHGNWAVTGGLTKTANTLTCANSTGGQNVIDSVPNNNVLVGQSWVATFRVLYVDIRYVQITGGAAGFGTGQYCNFDLVDGDYTATGCTATITPVSAGVWDISVLLTVTAATQHGTTPFSLVNSQSATRAQAFTGDGIKSVGVLRYQLENVTGQLDQTAGEYVSVGVLSAPWHGGGADGIKYFATNKDLTVIPDALMLGAHIDPASKTNSLLWCRDLTNAAWVKTNCTPLKTQTGIDGLASACSLLTATSADATCLQTITTAAVAACSGFWVKRSVGVGNIYITRDGGSNWTDITSLINSSTFTKVKIENTSVLNPVVGFKIETSGDAIIVDAGLNHTGTVLCCPIFTTTAAVTRNAEVFTYPIAGNFSDTAGTILATVYRDNWTNNHDGLIGSTTSGLGTLATNGGVKAVDGTNTANGPVATPTDTMHLAIRWSGSTLEALSEAMPGTAGTYDGAFGLATIGIGVGGISNIRDVKIYDTALTDTEISSIFGLGVSLWDNDAVKAFLIAKGFPATYNDGLLAYFRDLYSVTNSTLPDLMAKYRKANGDVL